MWPASALRGEQPEASQQRCISGTANRTVRQVNANQTSAISAADSYISMCRRRPWAQGYCHCCGRTWRAAWVSRWRRPSRPSAAGASQRCSAVLRACCHSTPPCWACSAGLPAWLSAACCCCSGLLRGISRRSPALFSPLLAVGGLCTYCHSLWPAMVFCRPEL